MRALRLAATGKLYYGWVILSAVSITEVISWGILYYAYTVFVAPMQQELGWSPVAMSGAYSAALLSTGLAAVPMGVWLDRHGPRVLMTVGSIAATLLLVAWAQVHDLWVFYLIMIGIGLASAAVHYEPAFVIVATWFRHQRGRALTVLTFFGAWASFVFIPLSQWLVTHFGWRPALLALALLLALITIPIHALILRRRPEDLGLVPDGEEELADTTRTLPAEQSITTRNALRDPHFWWLSFAVATSNIATVAMTVHLIAYLIDRGHSSGFAATVAGLFGLMSLAGRLLIGPLGGRYSRVGITAVLLGMQALGLLILLFLPTTIGALVYAALFGAGSGTMTIMRAALVAERYGPAHYGRINGAQNLFLTGARTLAPIGAGALAVALGGYGGMLGVLIVLTLLGSVSMLVAAPNLARHS